jgi:hypothetical protein
MEMRQNCTQERRDSNLMKLVVSYNIFLKKLNGTSISTFYQYFG